MLLNSLFVILAFAASFYAPGRLAYMLLSGPRPRGETFVVATGLGFVLVGSSTVLLQGCLLGQHLGLGLGPVTVLSVAAAISIALAVLLRRQGRLGRGLMRQRPNGDQIALAALTAIATLFFLVNFDADQIIHTSCIFDGISSLALPVSAPATLPCFEGDFSQQRLGIGIFVSPLVALFGSLGFRLAYALHGLLAPGLGFALGHHIFGRRAPAWLLAVLFTWSGYALETRVFDENSMASLFGALTLVLLLRPTLAPVAAGVAMSLFLALRHVAVTLVPVVMLFIWHRARRGRAAPSKSLPALSFLLATLVLLSPCVIIHIQRFVMGDGLMEGLLDALTPHSFLGWEFTAGRLWNWPLVPEPVRAPFQPHTNLLHYPLDLVRRFGIPLLALVPVGFLWLRRRERALPWTLLAWFGLPLLPILFMSNWFQPNKVGIPATTIAPLLVFMVAGAAALWEARRAPWGRLAAVGATAFACVALVLGARHAEAPLDLRMREAFTVSEHERPDLHVYDEAPYLEWARARLGLRLLPVAREGFWHASLLRHQLRQLGHDLAEPGIRQHARPVQDHFWGLCEWSHEQPQFRSYQGRMGGEYGPRLREPRDVSEARGRYTLDLRVAPTVAPDALVPGGTGAPPLILGDGEVVIVDGVTAPWSHFPMRLFLARDHLGAVHIVVLPVAPGDVPCRRPADPLTRSLDMRDWPDGRIPLDLPVGAVVRLQDNRNPFFGIAFVRFAALGSGTVWLSATEQMTLYHRMPAGPAETSLP